ncbi:C1 family peptidase [Pedobacter frigiditerrae]|uniref:C1 family peptidase n=1 Tax=Pedobacter frigiditerrae TaxID=2530452 RepID=UPI00293160E4|nr:C1 family peptidase [Pedobacter frigiditerrae]
MHLKKFNCFLVLLSLCINTFSQTPYGRGLDLDDNAYKATPKKAKLTRNLDIVPSAASIKMYAPTPGHQSYYGTCTAWASAYCGKTIVDAIKHNWTDKAYITDHAYSPAFLYRLLKPDDLKCVGGSSIFIALELMKNKGVLPYKSLSSLCTESISETQLNIATNSKIKDYLKIFENSDPAKIKIQAVKKSISERKPVLIGMTCPPSFGLANKKELWTPTESPNGSFGAHAMCVVGYDDSKFGGAFEVQNSWGTIWGTMGYIWIKYEDFASFTNYAFEFIDLPETKPNVPDLSGQITLTLANNTAIPTNLFMASRGLKVVPAKTTSGPLTIYQTTKAYNSGTRFRIYISNNQPAFVYAISSDLTNEITKIFPYNDGISAALTDRKNNVAIPDEDHFIEFDERPGKDFLCVLYSKEPLDINEIIKRIAFEKGSFNEKIYAVLKNQIVEPSDITFLKDKIGFSGFSKGKSTVALMVELDHN